MAPIDPLQLLRALSPLLSPDGGIKSIEEVVRLASLMKKFSRKLVSRCVYVNVLRASKPETLEAFLNKGGWETIHNWLQDTKKSENYSFLVELLKLYKILPMTVERLKENSSAKVIKTLSKHEREDIKTVATEVVNSWVKLVKGEPNAATDDKVVKKKKTKKDDRKDGKHERDKEKDKKDGKDDKRDKKLNKDSKSSKLAKENNKVSSQKGDDGKRTDELEDVKLPDYILNRQKDLKTTKERKSTVKTYQAKFRSIGLEEATPLPKPVSKKPVVDKAANSSVPAKDPVKRISALTPEDNIPPTKKPKPLSLSIDKPEAASTTPGTDSDASASPGSKTKLLRSPLSKPDAGDKVDKAPSGTPQKPETERREIKLIPPRPKLMHTLTESAGFMDALVAGPTLPMRKKKKASPKPTKPETPPSPTTTTPKLQFYKDTLETQEETANTEATDKEPVEAMDTEEANEVEMVADTSEKLDRPSAATPDIKDEETPNTELSPSEVTNKKKKKRKTVTWAEESNLKQVFYFEMDETERVNVNNLKNFGDLKTLERLNERHAVESARRMQGDTMEEKMSWLPLIPIDLPPALVTPGCNSLERDVQKAREESVLQEIFFSKESLPDAPHEPDPDLVETEEPKVIPLEDENNPDAIVDYSMMEPPPLVTALPPALTNLVMSISAKHTGFAGPNQNPMEIADMNMMSNEAPMGHHGFNSQGPPMMSPGNHGMMAMAPPTSGFDHRGGYPPPHGDYGPGPGHDYGPPPFEQMPPNMMEGGMDYYDGGMGGPDMGMGQGGPMMRRPGPGPNRGNRGRPGNNRGRGNMGPRRGGGGGGGMQNRNRGGGNREGGGQRTGRGSRQQTCRHFMAGSCKYEDSCIFLHPGFNRSSL